MPPPVTVEGKVVRKRVNRGSKSDHRAVVLVCAEREYTLRRRGEAPYGDPGLDSLVGRRVRATGTVSAGQLIMSDYAVVKD